MSLAAERKEDVLRNQEGEASSRSIFILDNTPTVVTYVLGTIILLFTGTLAPALYVLYCVLSTVAIWRFVCVHCHHYGGACRCGFSIAATRFFEKGDERLIESRMRLLALLVLPCWTVPVVVAVFLLMTSFYWVLLSLLLAFIIVAFVVAPLLSWKVGCCDIWRLSPRIR